MLRPVVFVLAAFGAAATAHADPPPAAPEASLVVWPASSAAEGAARALSDRAAERGAFEVVDAGLVRQRVSAGARVDIASFLGEVRRNVTAARSSLSAGSPQEAIDRLDSTLRDFVGDLGTPEGRETLRDLMVVRARALVSRNDPVAAAADATLAVRLDARSGAGIELTSFSPGERAVFTRVVQEAAAAGPGRLAIVTQPAGAAVVVDGVPRGATPLELEVPYGRHVVRVERFGNQPAAELVEVIAGQTTTSRHELPPSQGEDLLEQIAVRVGQGTFDASDPASLSVLARALAVRGVLVVESGPRIRARLFRDGDWIESGSADVTGPWDSLLERLERTALGRIGLAPGEHAPEPATPLAGRWWFWTGIGVIVAAGVVTGVLLATQEDPRGTVQWARP